MQRLFLAAGLFAAIAVLSLRAQTAVVTATIPFEFRLGDAQLPAGTYVIQESGATLVVKKESGRHAGAISLTNAASRRGQHASAELEFHRYGDSYFLANVWSANSAEGRSPPATPREKQIAARNGGPIQTASVALHK